MSIEFKRVKHGQLPGDLPKKDKIRMREHKQGFFAMYAQYMSTNACSTFQKELRQKGKTVQRQRDKQRIKEGLNEIVQEENLY